MQHVFLQAETLPNAVPLFFLTNFSSPIIGREEACLLQGCRLLDEQGADSHGSFHKFSWFYTSIYTSETKCPGIREFSLSHALLITFSEKSDSSQSDIYSHRSIVFFFSFVTCSELKSLKTKNFCYMFKIKVLEG